MRIIEQLKVKPKFNLRLYHNKGEYVKLVVTDDETKYGYDTIYLNILEDDINNGLVIALECHWGPEIVENITLISCIENSKLMLERCKVNISKIKTMLDTLSNQPGNYCSIKSVVNYTKVNIKKKVIQAYTYSNETKLPVSVFECEYKICDKWVELLTDKLTDLLTCHIIQ